MSTAIVISCAPESDSFTQCDTATDNQQTIGGATENRDDDLTTSQLASDDDVSMIDITTQKDTPVKMSFGCVAAPNACKRPAKTNNSLPNVSPSCITVDSTQQVTPVIHRCPPSVSKQTIPSWFKQARRMVFVTYLCKNNRHT